MVLFGHLFYAAVAALHSCNIEIPTIIDPVALGYFIVALGSIIVGISVAYIQPCESF
jgi:hypothetical protein